MFADFELPAIYFSTVSPASTAVAPKLLPVFIASRVS